MDDWLQTLLGTVLIGGTIAVCSHQAKKQGYNEALEDIRKKNESNEILMLRAELDNLKRNQIGTQNV